jgi:hypothetical protein
MLGDRIRNALKEASITYTEAALETGSIEGVLYTIFKKTASRWLILKKMGVC